MSDGSADSPLWMPDWGDMPTGARRVLVWLVIWRDGRGSCDPTNDELSEATGLDVSTVRKWTGWLAKEGWAKRERRRRADNSLGGWRYWLNLEKLGLKGGTSIKPAVALPAREPVENGGEGPAENQPSPSEREGGNDRWKSAGAQKSEGEKTAGLYRERGPARARPSLHLIPPSYAFRDADQERFLTLAVEACGVGVMAFDACEGLIESLAAAMDGWLADGFDPDLDIIPTIKRQTVHKRVKPIYDFVQARFLTDDMAKTRTARFARAEKASAHAAGAATSSAAKGSRAQGGQSLPLTDAKRREKIAGLQQMLANYDRGDLEGWRFYLPARDRGLDGEGFADAVRPIAAEKRAELERLLVEVQDGNGDGKA